MSPARVRSTSSRPTLRVLVLSLAVLVAAVLGLFLPNADADEAAPPGATPAAKKQYATGLSPLPDDRPVPLEWMPPGSKQSPVPSDEIFPPQPLTIRFTHEKHVKAQ